MRNEVNKMGLISRRAIGFFIVAVTISLLPTVAVAAAEDTAVVSVGLTAFGQTKLLHDRHESLPLRVIISNPLARFLAAWNGDPINDHSQRKIPSVDLGSTEQPTSSLVSFTYKGPDSVEKQLVPREITPFATALKLDENVDGRAVYAIDPKQFESIANGQIIVTATIRARNKDGKTGISASIDVNLADDLSTFSKPQRISRLAALGNFYVLDGKTDEALKCSQQLLSIDEFSVEAQQIAGDAYFQNQNRKKAKQAFNAALANYNRKYGEHGTTKRRPDLEPPTYVEQMLVRLQEEY
jgi:hypothetical protein